MASPEFFALQQAVAGRYSLLEEIGRGGMGIVFSARDVALDRPVAIKLLPPSLNVSDDAGALFVQEARTAASLQHPHVVPIHAVEERHGLVYFVMALVDGESLGERVRRTGPLPARDVVKVIQEVAWALCHAHGRAVVHRDVKPDNILIDRDSGRAIVTDFGIAQCMTCTPHSGGVPMGTPAYMSPELARGDKAGIASDIYALGVTAWVAATGRAPYPGPTAAAYLTQHAAASVPSLHEAAPSLPPAFAAAIDRCLAKDPAERWESAEALAEALDAGRVRLPAVPAPVRAFLREWDRVGAEVATAGTAAAVSAVLGLVLLAIPKPSFTAQILSSIYLLVAGLFAALSAERVAQLVMHARRLLRHGFDLRSLPGALRGDLAARVEESRATGLASGRVALVTGVAALGVTGVALWGLWHELGPVLTTVLAAKSVIAPTVAVRALWAYAHRNNPEGIWARLAGGRLGRAVFRLAGIGIAPNAAPALNAGEPTAVAVGAQARAAWNALTPSQQAQLADVPGIVERLERDVRAYSAGSDHPADVGRLESAVAALDLLRLDLLRLAASQHGAIELTAAVERVREIGYRVDGMLAADG